MCLGDIDLGYLLQPSLENLAPVRTNTALQRHLQQQSQGTHGGPGSGQNCHLSTDSCTLFTPTVLTWVSGTMGLRLGASLKKVESGDEMMTGSGRTNPLRSQLGMEFSSVFITSVSMA